MAADLSKLLQVVIDSAEFRKLVETVKKSDGATRMSVLDAARPYLIAALYQTLGVPVIVVTGRPEKARAMHDQITAWGGHGVLNFPEPDALPYERITADSSTELERVQVLSALANCAADRPPVIVASAPAVMSKVTPRAQFDGACHSIRTGMEIEPLVLLARWEKMGYRHEGIVEVPGTVSHRGGIVDVFPPTSEMPVRLEFFGNTVESIRSFDPVSQRSVKPVDTVTAGPTTELLAPRLAGKAKLETVLGSLDLSRCTPDVAEKFRQEIGMLFEGQRLRDALFYTPLFNDASILDYLPPDALLVIDEPNDLRLTLDELHTEAEQLRSEKVKSGELPANFPRPYFTWEELEAQLGKHRSLQLAAFGGETTSPELPFTSQSSFGGQLPVFIEKVKSLRQQQRRTVVVSQQAARLSEVFGTEDIIAVPATSIDTPPLPGSLTLVQGALAEGWVLGSELHLFTDNEVFGFVKQGRLIKKRPVPRRELFTEFKTGEHVVHIEHGIARFAGVTTLGNNGTKKEYLILQYAAGDTLYVPSDQIDRVSRYIGASDRPPTLSRLGSQEWVRTRQKAKEAAEKLAKELLDLYAAREVVPGHAYSRDTVWQQELEAAFPYVETPDQMRAQTEVKLDMEKPRPMDRLVCGDVGYGKTEVAIRAAFKAVMDGKQVAVLVPTTVLAEQHFTTFGQRLKAFPVKVEVLSRFKSHREQRTILEAVAAGTVDIVIGTHRLLQKDVVFKQLGLLVIDEEQRFGVAHKEYLKKMRREVDVLTLSATPIPRTLHMSLAGVRDMSIIETPPEERLPIKTYVSEYNERVIREAILREIERDGQVFFVHNRVQSIALVASKLRALVPEARTAIGHGQMPGEQLEAVMADFAAHKSDVLVCSTIIESGLDMPNVNTLIVNQADKMGLAQLYQLRGRVGRSANLAYAYFFYDREKRLTPAAQKRLRTIYEATELGAGFSIAIKDLEIRGAGTLLGARQSGHISAVGFNLYTRLLAEAVEELRTRRSAPPGKAIEIRHLPPPTIDLPLKAYIPDDYVADLDTRLSLYQSLAKLEKPELADDILQDFKDRFGEPPAEVANLLYAVKIKAMAAKAGIQSISGEDGQLVIRLFDGMVLNRQRLAAFAKDGLKVGTTQMSLDSNRLGARWREVLEKVVRGVG